jgi:hypothetical protein
MSQFDQWLLALFVACYLGGPIAVTFYAIWSEKRDRRPVGPTAKDSGRG